MANTRVLARKSSRAQLHKSSAWKAGSEQCCCCMHSHASPGTNTRKAPNNGEETSAVPLCHQPG